MQEYFIQFSAQHIYLVYTLIIVLAFIEGPVLSVMFGVLIKLGFFSFWPVYAALMAGDLLGDSFWYYIGRYYGHSFIRKFGKYFSINEEVVTKVDRIFHRFKNSILFASKITSGFGLALVTLITAGIVRIPFGRFIFINFLMNSCFKLIFEFFYFSILLTGLFYH